MKSPDYQVGDLVIISHADSPGVECLVLEIKKRYRFYEVKLLCPRKIFTIVDDGLYNIVKC